MTIEQLLKSMNQKKKLAIRCPFHNERTPSMVIELKSLRYHCFGCGADGEVNFSGISGIYMNFIDNSFRGD